MERELFRDDCRDEYCWPEIWDNEIYIPEMLVSAITMKKGLALIKPFL